jgi:hypothetical protein
LFVAWAPIAIVAAFVLLGAWAALAYVLVTWLGLHLLEPAQRRAVALHNALRAPSVRCAFLALRRLAQESIPE